MTYKEYIVEFEVKGYERVYVPITAQTSDEAVHLAAEAIPDVSHIHDMIDYEYSSVYEDLEEDEDVPVERYQSPSWHDEGQIYRR